jgi:hypothetical protein
MKDFIKDSIDLDQFIKYQNGNLVKIFGKYENDSKHINMEDYSTTMIYNATISNPIKISYLKNVINSYINFNNFLDDNEVEIDYKYLWDIISIPNEKLFNRGLNLVIIEIPDDDVTDNVEIICPSNHYSDELFNIKKPTVILMKKNNYFEPIYIYKDIETDIIIKKQFMIRDDDLMENI